MVVIQSRHGVAISMVIDIQFEDYILLEENGRYKLSQPFGQLEMLVTIVKDKLKISE